MIVSRNGTSYDTSDGSQQPHEGSAEGLQRSDREQINRWEDDGPGPHAHTAPHAANPPSKPAWSVLSLTNLLEAIRKLRHGPADPASPEDDRSDRSGALPERQRLHPSAGAADAERTRYRNAWENT